MRYLSYKDPTTMPKIITASEFAALRAAGLSITLNWEYDARDLVNSGFNATDAAHEALRQANALPYPDFRVIYWSADFDVQASDWALMASRLRAIAAVIGLNRVGLYAPYDALSWAARDGVATWFWQAGMSTDWSGGRNAQLWPGAHLRQRLQVTIDGADCDANDIIRSDYGQGGGSMEQGDIIQAWAGKARPISIGAFFGDVENVRDYLVSKPGDPLVVQPDPQSRLEILTRAAQQILANQPTPVAITDAQLAALEGQVVAALSGKMDALSSKVDQVLAHLAAAGHALDS
jgi:hypothetical protein